MYNIASVEASTVDITVITPVLKVKGGEAFCPKSAPSYSLKCQWLHQNHFDFVHIYNHLSISVQDFESKIKQYGDITVRNKTPVLKLKKPTQCDDHTYPFCGRKVSIHYPINNVAMREQGKVTIRCMLCNGSKVVALSQYRRDRANHK